jgi:hypothetical protein
MELLIKDNIKPNITLKAGKNDPEGRNCGNVGTY